MTRVMCTSAKKMVTPAIRMCHRNGIWYSPRNTRTPVTTVIIMQMYVMIPN